MDTKSYEELKNILKEETKARFLIFSCIRLANGDSSIDSIRFVQSIVDLLRYEIREGTRLKRFEREDIPEHFVAMVKYDSEIDEIIVYFYDRQSRKRPWAIIVPLIGEVS